MPTDYAPVVTIIMPVRNESKFIERSLGAVLSQDYPAAKTEILIADGMSDDNTRDIISRMAAQHPGVSLKILDNQGRTSTKGRNVGISNARGDVLIFVDGHCEIAPDYITECVKCLAREDILVVGGPIETLGLPPAGETIAAAMTSKFGVGGVAFRTIKDKEMFADTVAFGAYKRKVIDAVGPFDENMVATDDDEYNYRLRSLGYQLLLTPKVHSHYYCRNSLPSLWRQYFKYGFYKVRVFQKYPQQMRPRQFIPPAFVAALLGTALLAPFNGIIRYGFFLVLALYIVANLAASVFVSSKEGWKHLLLLPFVFATLHFSYGSGFLLGLLSLLSTKATPANSVTPVPK